MPAIPTPRTELRRVGNDIRVDVLLGEFFVVAPPMTVLWLTPVNFGMLPIGTYNLDARLFWIARDTGQSFPDPWHFPDAIELLLSPDAIRSLRASKRRQDS